MKFQSIHDPLCENLRGDEFLCYKFFLISHFKADFRLPDKIVYFILFQYLQVNTLCRNETTKLSRFMS